MREFQYILVSENAYQSNDLINSNISVINYLRASEVNDDELHPDAFSSYCVDYFFTTLKQDGLASYIYKTKWEIELIEITHAGLSAIGNQEYTEFFEKQIRKVKLFSKIKLDKFLSAKEGSLKDIASQLEDQQHKSFTSDLKADHENWLRNHPDLKAVTIEEMQSIITDFCNTENPLEQ
ncbi:hypothetical protein VSO92_12285 [Myroides pelagicus]|uniref:DMP19 family protein n=1 Tax=Myroides pelagicus TaxID=270914 RepID=UPI002DB800C3|nr:hypothetical protein [Myroides pelagicus]MEC4114880.1 hypothetical protein [Myroides pelagicus]